MDAVLFKEFEDFFMDAFKKHLSKNHVIEIKGVGYYFITERAARIGTNPMTGKKVSFSSKNILSFLEEGFSEKEIVRSEFTEKELLESLDRNAIPLARLDFPRLTELISAIRSEAQRLPSGERFGIAADEDLNILEYKLVPPQSTPVRYPDGSSGRIESPEKIAIRGGEQLKEKIRSLPDAGLVYQFRSLSDEELSEFNYAILERAIGLRKQNDPETLDR